MSQKFVDILFGGYAPDWGGMPRQEEPGYVVGSLGVRSTPNGYRGMPTFENVTSATAIGSSAITRVYGALYFAGAVASTSDRLFIVTNNAEMYESRAMGTDTWQNVSPSSGTVSDGDFLRFEDDAIYVSSGRAPVKKTITATHATLFSSLAGSPPTAATGARVRNHVVLGQLQGVDMYAIQTSAIGNHEDWPTPGTADARSKQSIRESLNPEFGVVRYVVGGEKFGLIFQESAITRMTYVGGAEVYTFDTFERSQGCGYETLFSKPVTDGKLWYWYNSSGFFVTDGYSVRCLSKGKIDEAIFSNTISHSRGSDLKASNTGAYDQSRGLIVFANTFFSGGTKYQLVYDVVNDSFAFMNEDNETGIFSFYNSETDAGPHLYTVNASDRKLQRWSGSGSTLSMQTGYLELEPGHRVQIQGAHLIGANISPSTPAIFYKGAQSYDDVDLSQSGYTALTVSSRGFLQSGRADAPFFSFLISGTAAENQLYRGIRVYYERTAPQ